MYRLVKFLHLVGLIFWLGCCAAFVARAGGPMGIDGGVVVSGSTINLTSTVASNLVAGKTGWIRVNMILPSGHTSWDSAALGYYDQAINNARAAGLQVLILMNNQGYNGTVSNQPWNTNNFENTGGNGDNPYIDSWVNAVVVPVAQHFHDRVKVYEIWNEPSTWANSNSPTSFNGGTWVYPSCYSWMLTKSWLAVHQTLGYGDVKVISSDCGQHFNVGVPVTNNYDAYLKSVYNLGTNASVGSFSPVHASYGTYPMDGLGQHLYIDYNTQTTTAKFQSFLNVLYHSFTNYEGAASGKRTYLTEFGWNTTYVSQQMQANDLANAFLAIEAPNSFVQMAIWFTWQDGGAGNFGVFDSSGHPKISYANYVFYEKYEGDYTNGAVETNLLNYFNSGGQAVYGDAFDNGSSAFVHSVAGGSYLAQAQDFDGGSHQKVTIFDVSNAVGHAAYELNDLHGFWTYYNGYGGTTAFGPPLNNEYLYSTGTRQDFASGSLVWNSASGTVASSLSLTAYAVTEAATKISATNATLNGIVLANGTNLITAWFEWGTNANYGQRTAITNVGAGLQVVLISTNLGGLALGQVYHFRLVASNSVGVVYGVDRTFTTGSHVKAWGDNTYGQTNLPVRLTNAILVASGAYHGLALENNGSVIGWGLNTLGETTVPGSLTNAVAISAGLTHSLALKADGSVTAWGGNAFGQLNVPSGLTNVMAIAAGGYHNLALRKDGTVTAWGYNSNGQTNVPAGLVNCVAVAAGQYHSLALLANGTVIAWGDFTYGQTNVPATLSNVVSICAGQYHNLALKSDGTVMTWGRNNLGQTNLPAGLTNVAAIACGDNYSLALRSDGTLIAWGDNGYDQTNLPMGLGQITQLAGGMNSGLLLGSQLPQAGHVSISGYVNHDLLIGLSGIMGDGNALNYRIITLPLGGTLFQSAAGTRGEAILMPNTGVNDPGGQVVFAPATNQTGLPYDSFNYVVNDGLNNSAAAAVSVNISLPPMPSLINPVYDAGLNNGVFKLTFGSVSNATYGVWASTNLTDWNQVGTTTELNTGQYEFLDATTSQLERFYRLSTP